MAFGTAAVLWSWSSISEPTAGRAAIVVFGRAAPTDGNPREIVFPESELFVTSEYAAYLARRVLRALERVPGSERPGVYVVNLFVLSADSDPRHHPVSVSANTERHRDGKRQRADDEFIARSASWDPASFLYQELEVIGDPDVDPEGAEEWKSYALNYLIGWDESVPGHGIELDDDDVEGLRLAFLSEAVNAANVLHDGPLSRLLGREPTVTIDTDEFSDPVVLCNEQANPAGLPDDAAAWYRAREGWTA